MISVVSDKIFSAKTVAVLFSILLLCLSAADVFPPLLDNCDLGGLFFFNVGSLFSFLSGSPPPLAVLEDADRAVFRRPISPEVKSRLIIAAVPVTESTHTSSLNKIHLLYPR